MDGLDDLWDANVTDHRAARGAPAREPRLSLRRLAQAPGACFGGGRVSTGMLAQPNGPPTPLAQHAIFRDAFAGATPIHEDALVVVYAID